MMAVASALELLKERKTMEQIKKEQKHYDLEKVLEQLQRLSDEEEDKISVC